MTTFSPIPMGDGLPITDWYPLLDLLDADPSSLGAPVSSAAHIRLAKDADFAQSVQEAWRAELAERDQKTMHAGTTGSQIRSIGREITYKDVDGTVLHGYAVMRSDDVQRTRKPVPGIILFHTGAGPQDIFLRWKADTLVTDVDTFPDGGCVVLIADLISDGEGWAWDDDRTRYNNARDEVLRPVAGIRQTLQNRIQAAVRTVKALGGVDSERISALGFCMGGHPCLELGRMELDGMRAVATFHGVFDGTVGAKGSVTNKKKLLQVNGKSPAPRALIFHGSSDPFVTSQQLQACEEVFVSHNWEWELKSFEEVRHGFTNPAQDFNPNKAFAYNENAANEAWKATLALLKEQLK
eukprot:CAMPEP_0194342974 /NCGR_PEP_ID=MMETSP0171-20130528/94636_1 /TAXON_ID=218684 /ORGANISM="Corethron pennatum, Strain L29A3" /LENGTH=352 /DNA_ID=CAMNT_0039108929 /DNA_START=142 /DNA_END=1200 /DNA_ORIENTATION=-